ncbi:MAG: hypothetical protein PUP91_28405 [Rhizonema sp. PD37]|nr:hypothetical protein [Rhizonema sp. PD37]
MLASSDPEAKPKLSPLNTILFFPIHFQLPCIGPKGWSTGFDEPGTPPALESLAMTLPPAVRVRSSRNVEDGVVVFPCVNVESYVPTIPLLHKLLL